MSWKKASSTFGIMLGMETKANQVPGPPSHDVCREVKQ